MDCEQNKEITTEQKPEYTRLRKILRVAFIVFNALVILFALLPALLPISWRGFTILTPWHFYRGYGTPLGLPIEHSLILALLCGVHVVFCTELPKLGKRALIKFCTFSVVAYGLCIFMFIGASDSPADYFRGSLLRDLESYHVTVRMQTNLERNWSGITIYASSDQISINEFEPFVTEMQALAFQTAQRRRTNDFNLTIILYEPNNRERLSWLLRGDGDFGILDLRQWFPPLFCTVGGYSILFGGGWGNEQDNLLPTASIQETITAVTAVESFVKELAHDLLLEHNQISVLISQFLNDDGNIEVDASKIDLSIRHTPETSPFFSSEVGAAFIEIDRQVRAGAERHDMEIQSLTLWFQPYDLKTFAHWQSDVHGKYGTLWFGEYEFEHVHITEIQAFLTEERIEAIRAENQIREEAGY